MYAFYQIGDFIGNWRRVRSNSFSSMRMESLGAFNKKDVILCYVFGTEIGKHVPGNCGMAAGQIGAVLSERIGTWIISIKET